jgi:hypothetical protein
MAGLVGPTDPADLLSRPGISATFDLVGSSILSNGVIVATSRP